MILLRLFWVFLRIGAFTFGGGYAMIPLIQGEVTAAGWMTAEELVNFIAVSESTPGPFAVNIATYVGMETAGVAGALCGHLRRGAALFYSHSACRPAVHPLCPQFAGGGGDERSAAHGSGADRSSSSLRGANPAFTLPAAAWEGLLASDLLWALPIFCSGCVFSVEETMASHCRDSAGRRPGNSGGLYPGSGFSRCIKQKG